MAMAAAGAKGVRLPSARTAAWISPFLSCLTLACSLPMEPPRKSLTRIFPSDSFSMISLNFSKATACRLPVGLAVAAIIMVLLYPAANAEVVINNAATNRVNAFFIFALQLIRWLLFGNIQVCKTDLEHGVH